MRPTSVKATYFGEKTFKDVECSLTLLPRDLSRTFISRGKQWSQNDGIKMIKVISTLLDNGIVMDFSWLFSRYREYLAKQKSWSLACDYACI